MTKHDDVVDDESQAFRDALLNGQQANEEKLVRLIKLTDTRFVGIRRLMREHRDEHKVQSERMIRLLLAGVTAAPSLAVAVLKVFEWSL